MNNLKWNSEDENKKIIIDLIDNNDNNLYPILTKAFSSSGTKIEFSDSSFKEILFYACKKNKISSLDKIKNYLPLFNVNFEDKNEIFIDAVKNENIDLIDFLINKSTITKSAAGPSEGIINFSLIPDKDTINKSIIYIANFGNIDCLKTLISSMRILHCLDEKTLEDAFKIAFEKKHVKILKSLIKDFVVLYGDNFLDLGPKNNIFNFLREEKLKNNNIEILNEIKLDVDALKIFRLIFRAIKINSLSLMKEIGDSKELKNIIDLSGNLSPIVLSYANAEILKYLIMDLKIAKTQEVDKWLESYSRDNNLANLKSKIFDLFEERSLRSEIEELQTELSNNNSFAAVKKRASNL